ncbi:MAG: NAD(P)H-hydrate dehydratase [Chloroflexi bacterium]|nr:NAD(P)H-hydrate dehydratase [Ardenticatenaceae bacterium]MBL1130946.1 NAD(P)H-hydrate dehydratase [Chloroflexota bacterium]NOG37043.1 NAD(P)H-hydrate dehydratase [Chloroflexota bacterium]
MKVFTVSQMVAAERAADAAGVSYAQMMESAGQAVAEAIMARYAVAGMRVLVLVGPGNNGGDGLVCGRYLAQAGADVAFYLSKQRNPATDANYAHIQQMGLFAVEAEFDQRFRVLRTRLSVSDLVVDALLGTGVTRPIGGELAKLMRQFAAGVEERRTTLRAHIQPRLVSLDFNAEGPQVVGQRRREGSMLPVVAVDCPSGLNCDTGELDALAVPADLTVTFAGPKRGHFIFPGAAACGELVVADIGIPAGLPVVQAVNVEMVTAVHAHSLLPPRPKDGHKGSFGKVLIAAGCDRYRGAPVLAAKGAFRAGAGLVALATPDVVRQTAVVALPEATYPPIAAQKVLPAEAAATLRPTLSHYDALLLGPGLGETAVEFLSTLLTAPHLPPLIVDADGLNGLAQLPDWPRLLPPDTVLTPHPAEMARLMGIPLADLLARDRVDVAREQAQAWGQIVLLKGAYTVVAAPDGRVTILPFANPALAVGGSGDVLSGLIVALLGQGVRPVDAAILSGYLHGAAGALYPGDTGLLASELADLIPQVIQSLKGNG